MPAECFRVKVSASSRIAGFTAGGQRVAVMPGEYVVHRVKPKVPICGVAEALRFLGADPHGRDVHVPVERGVDVLTVLEDAETLSN